MIARLSLLLVCLTSALAAWGQGRVHLYPDDNLVWRDMVAHVDGGVVRMGNNWSGDIVFTLQDDNMWDEVRIFQGYSTSALDVATRSVTTSSTWATAVLRRHPLHL